MSVETAEQVDRAAAEFAKKLPIPPCPTIINRIVRESHADEPDLRAIGEWVAQDVALVATLLHTVNSPFYGLRQPIGSVQQALMMLGLRTVKSLVMGLLLRQAFPRTTSPGLQRFWRDSSRSAALGAFVSQSVGRFDRDLAYTFGLFRRCGMPMIRTQFVDYEPIIARTVPARGLPLIALEREKFGVDHPQAGFHLASTWHLGREACDAILHSVDYPASPDARGLADPKSTKLVALGVVVDWIDDRINRVESKMADEFEFALDCLDINAEDVEALAVSAPEALRGVA